MKKSENVDKILPAFQKFQQEVINPKKDTEGYGYKYATLDSVIAVVKEAMEPHGLSFNQEVGYDEKGNITVTTNIFHESGQWLSFGPLGLPKDNGQQRSAVQAAGSAITYARRYSLSAVMGIASEEDDDGYNPKPKNNSYDNKQSKKSKQKNKSKTQKQQLINQIAAMHKTDKEKVEPIISYKLDENDLNSGNLKEIAKLELNELKDLKKRINNRLTS